MIREERGVQCKKLFTEFCVSLLAYDASHAAISDLRALGGDTVTADPEKSGFGSF